jgi:hypothetical protein
MVSVWWRWPAGCRFHAVMSTTSMPSCDPLRVSLADPSMRRSGLSQMRAFALGCRFWTVVWHQPEDQTTRSETPGPHPHPALCHKLCPSAPSHTESSSSPRLCSRRLWHGQWNIGGPCNHTTSGAATTFLQSHQSDASRARSPTPGLTALQSVVLSTHDSTLPSESRDQCDVDDGIEPVHLALSLNPASFRDVRGLNRINAVPTSGTNCVEDPVNSHPTGAWRVQTIRLRRLTTPCFPLLSFFESSGNYLPQRRDERLFYPTTAGAS